MLTKKFVKRSFTFKFYVKVWSCNNPLSHRLYKISGQGRTSRKENSPVKGNIFQIIIQSTHKIL